MRAVHERRLEELENRLAVGEFDDPLHRLTIEFGVGWNSWARNWCLGLEGALGERDGQPLPRDMKVGA
jgi:hypothetical protein